ncbi:Hypothetical_protein [Hexamita inflata]|uniref:Hypothetical_protein n=1 Tax=Hexamita inflata TaxID=28002 RepID=A0AA86N7N9_9EUKA|nr:Hypothetical protein HINF_LOCUS1871 [Hexamita inflata]
MDLYEAKRMITNLQDYIDILKETKRSGRGGSDIGVSKEFQENTINVLTNVVSSFSQFQDDAIQLIQTLTQKVSMLEQLQNLSAVGQITQQQQINNKDAIIIDMPIKSKPKK